MESSYWSRILTQRTLTRRRALAASLGVAGTGLALSLIGCGGGSDDGSSSSGPKDSSGLLTDVVDTTKQAKAGGIWQHYVNRDLDGLDQFAGRYIPVNNGGTHVYSRLLKMKTGTKDSPPDGTAEGDAAQSFELTPDGLTMTFKLRPNMKFDQRAPTNGRLLDSEDVRFSWEKFKRIATSAAEVSAEKNPASPVASLTYPDKNTVVAKMAFPTAAIQSLFAYYRYLVIQPREGEDKIDLRQDMRGTGPWTLTKYTPSASFEWTKNPDWYISGRPFLDGISQPIVTEYATGLSQFKAGNIWQYAVRPEDVVATKKAEQRLTMFARGNFGLGAGYNLLGFSQKPNQPYTDVRLRQATSMAIDRDLWIETFFNVSKFESEGLPVRTAWFSHIHPGYPRYYVDPKSSEFGENGKYFKYDLAEAKKLASAAGITRPLEVPLAFQQVSATGQKEAEVLAGFLEAAGLFKPTLKALDPDGWLREAHTGGGTWDGLTAGIPTGGGPDIDQLFSARYISGASQYSMFPSPLPKIHDLMVKQRLELDANKREQLIKLEIARTMAAEMPAVPMGGTAEAFDLVWPHLANYGVFQTPERYEPMDVYPFLWYDASKKA